MAARIGFHLDEHCHFAVAEGLRRRGIGVSTTAEANLLGAPDDQQLAYASAHGRVLVTCDADFLRLHRRGIKHAGIVYCHQGQRSVGEILRSLVLMAELLTHEDMVNHVEFI